MKEVSERMGHKDSKITMEVSAYINEKQEEQAVDTFMNTKKNKNTSLFRIQFFSHIYTFCI